MIPKFRAWDKNKKWMVYDVQDAYDGLWSERNSDEINDYYGYVSNFQSFTDEESFNFMQCTGSKDKNGVEIYEGDIIKGRGGLASFIEFDEDDLSFKSVSRYCGKLYVPKGYLNKYTEVIGNIYENPELLEVAE